MSLEDANCLWRARFRVPNYPTRALQPQPGPFSAHPMPVDVSGCYQREPSSGAMTRPHRVLMSAIWSICAGQHSIRRHLNAAISGYVVVVTTSDMGIFALRESGRDWKGVAMLRGTKTLASMESKATSPWSKLGRGLKARPCMVLGPTGHFSHSAANIAVYLQGVDVLLCGGFANCPGNLAPGGKGRHRGMERMSRDGGSCRGTVSDRQGWWLVPDEFGNFV